MFEYKLLNVQQGVCERKSYQSTHFINRIGGDFGEEHYERQREREKEGAVCSYTYG